MGSRFVGANFIVAPEGEIAVFPRTATDVVRALPDVEIHGPRDIDCGQDWIAVHAGDGTDRQSMRDATAGLESAGLAICHYEVRSSDPPRNLLTVYAGADDLDDFIPTIIAVARNMDVEWASWIAAAARGLIPHVEVHRCKSWDTVRLRDQLEVMLGIPISCQYHPDHEDSGVIGAPRNEVDRVLDVLRSC